MLSGILHREFNLIKDSLPGILFSICINLAILIIIYGVFLEIENENKYIICALCAIITSLQTLNMQLGEIDSREEIFVNYYPFWSDILNFILIRAVCFILIYLFVFSIYSMIFLHDSSGSSLLKYAISSFFIIFNISTLSIILLSSSNIGESSRKIKSIVSIFTVILSVPAILFLGLDSEKTTILFCAMLVGMILNIVFGIFFIRRYD